MSRMTEARGAFLKIHILVQIIFVAIDFLPYICPFFSVFSEEEPDLNNELEISTAETVETIVTQLMEKQRAARAAALNKQVRSTSSHCVQKS